MPTPPQFVSSMWFSVLAGLLVSLGAQALIGAITPFDWLSDETHSEPVVLIAGVTSFWRGETMIRAVSFGLGALVACLLARSHTWQLLAGLVGAALFATAFAQFPRPAAVWQLALWAIAAPAAALLVGMLFRAFNGDA